MSSLSSNSLTTADVDGRELAFIAVERTRMPMVVTDARQPDNPIVLANRAFLDMSGYRSSEVLGRNCRFMQGPDTDRAEVAKLAASIAAVRDETVEILNYRRDGSPFWNQLFVSPIIDDAGELRYFYASQLDVSRRRAAQASELSERRLLREIDHRAKNALALVQGIVRLSRSDDVARYTRSIEGRIDALAVAHTVLADCRWHDVPLDRLLHSAVAHFSAQRIKLDGPAVILPTEQVQPLALVFHEIMDNAARHGALSTAKGQVDITWHVAGDRNVIEFVETGGPPLPVPRASGFGLTIIKSTIARQLRGEVNLDWSANGAKTRIAVPVR